MDLKTVAVWGSQKLPGGYQLLGVLILDVTTDLYFVVGAPSVWVRTASQLELSRALIKTIERELLNAVPRRKIN